MPLTQLTMRRRGHGAIVPTFDLTPKALPGAFKIGINVSGPESTYTSPQGTLLSNPYPDWPMLMHWASRGLNYIRLPLSWQLLQPALGGAISATEFKNVSRVMSMAAILGMSILMDYNHSTADGAGRSEGAIGSSTVPTTAIADYAGKFVAACRADPNYAVVRGWDTTNEPHHMDPNDGTNTSTSVSRATVLDMLQKIINAIRLTGDTKQIYCEADHYSGAWDWVPNNAALFLALTDTTNNLIASVHTYFDRDSSGSHFAWLAELAATGFAPPNLSTNINIGVQRLSAVVAWAYTHGVKLHLGECGWGFDNDGWRQAGLALLTYLRACNIEFTYWSSGYNFNTGTNYYGYSPDPYNAATGLVDWTPRNTSRPQSLLLQTYAAAPTAFPLFLPVDGSGNAIGKGTAGTASGAFKFLIGGTVTSAITVAPRARFVDGTAAGGTFSPASITIPAGAYVDQLYQFTYTPSTSDVFMIDMVNGGGTVVPSVAKVDTDGNAVLSALGFSSATDNLIPFASSNIINVYGLRRLNSSYVGPAIRLQRASDSAQKDFYFNRRGDLKRQEIQDWVSSRSIPVITVYDQGPAGNHLYVTQASPILTLVNAAGYPEITVGSGQGMGFNSPVDGNAQQSIIARLYDVNGGSTFVSQDNVNSHPFRFSPSGYSVLNPAVTVNPGRIANAWHHYAGIYSSGVTNGLIAYRDGASVATATTTGALSDPNGSSTCLGFFGQYTPILWTGSWQNLIMLSVAATAAQVAAFANDDTTYYGAALPDTLSAVNPTIAGAAPQSVVAGSNDQPFASVTISDTNSGTPTDSATITLSGSGGTLTGTSLTGSGPYSIAAASAASITSTLRALTFTPSGTAGAQTTLALAVTSSAGTSASNAATVVTVAAYQAETPFAAPATLGAARSNSKGANLSGAESNNDSTRPYGYDFLYEANSSVDYFAGKGFGVLRLPITSDRVYRTAYGLLDSNRAANAPSGGDWAEIKRIADRCAYWGMQLIIDVHNYGYIHDSRIGNGSNDSRVIGLDAEGTNLFADLWGRIATLFKNNPFVVFGLMNEPNNGSLVATVWKAAALKARDAIRTTGATQLILFQGCYGDAAQGWTGTGNSNANAWAGYTGDTNFAIEVHQYLDQGNSGQTATVATGSGSSTLTAATTWARTNGIKLFLGEFGWPPNPYSGTANTFATEAGAILDYMNSNADVWMGWAYFTGGTRNAPAGYITGIGSGPTDAQQIALLTAHL